MAWPRAGVECGNHARYPGRWRCSVYTNYYSPRSGVPFSLDRRRTTAQADNTRTWFYLDSEQSAVSDCKKQRHCRGHIPHVTCETYSYTPPDCGISSAQCGRVQTCPGFRPSWTYCNGRTWTGYGRTRMDMDDYRRMDLRHAHTRAVKETRSTNLLSVPPVN